MNPLKVKLLSTRARLPSRAHEDDAGWDLYCPSLTTLGPNQVKVIPLGLAVELPTGTVGFLKDRSSVGRQGVHVLGGVMDSSYRGEYMVTLANLLPQTVVLNQGDRVCQLVVLRLQPFSGVEEADTLSETPRGEGAFGSSGK